MEVLFAKVVFEQKIIFQGVSNQVSEEQEQVPLKICRGKDDITTFFKVGIENSTLITNSYSQIWKIVNN